MFKKVTNDAILPTRGSKYSACVDVYANENITIGAGETKLVGLGIAIDLDSLLENVPMVKDMKRWHKKRFKAGIIDVSEEDSLIHIKDKFLKSHYLQLMIRSSLSAKGLMLANGVGVIDLDFVDEIKMNIHNPISWSCNATDGTYEDNPALEHIHSGADNKVEYVIKKGDRIGQLILLEHKSSLFGIESEDERNGGFGSTDKKENK